MVVSLVKHPVRVPPVKPLNGYIALYQGKRIEVYAATSYLAQQKAVAQLKLAKKQSYLVTVHLTEVAGETVTHVAVD